jgi:hypothetical protein
MLPPAFNHDPRHWIGTSNTTNVDCPQRCFPLRLVQYHADVTITSRAGAGEIPVHQRNVFQVLTFLGALSYN